MFFFDPSCLKILVKFSKLFHILLRTIWPTNGEKYSKIVGSMFEKFHLKIAIFQILPILLGEF